MKNFRILIAALAFITFFSACKKDDAPVKPSKTKAEMLSSASGKRWKLMTSMAKVPGSPQTIDVLEDLDLCSKDDLTIFFANQKFEEREGATKCDSEDEDLIDEGTWELRNNDTQLAYKYDGYTLLMTIKELTENTIKVEFTTDAFGPTIQFNNTYQAQ